MINKVTPEFSFTEDEMREIVLKDDETESGGTAHFGETLKEFCVCVFELTIKHTIEDINNALKIC